MSERVALLSVRPRFALALLDGSKTVEIRRRRAHIVDGAVCLLYASSPVSAIVGAITVQSTDTGEAHILWQRWGDRTGLSRYEYDSYLDGRSHACAIVLAAAVSFPRPIALAELRQRHRPFVTPQSYRFLAEGELSRLLNGEAAHLRRLRRASPQSAG